MRGDVVETKWVEVVAETKWCAARVRRCREDKVGGPQKRGDIVETKGIAVETK